MGLVTFNQTNAIDAIISDITNLMEIIAQLFV